MNTQSPKTPIMKHLFVITVLLATLVSCTKESTEEPLDPNKAYTIKFDMNDQVTKTRVSNDTLYLDFQQKLNFLVDPTEYSRSWALHLTQDFSNSYLNNLHYSLLAGSGIMANDWVTLNLNDVHPSQLSESQATVNGQNYTKVTLTREFKFYSKLASAQAAIDKQTALLNTTSETVEYASFYSQGDVYSVPNIATAKIVYQK